ncbi:MAG: ABC transporter permease [Lachnospiraceae bacterium]|nr:ABC transporter permease [Lachnospiraceae bacterium]
MSQIVEYIKMAIENIKANKGRSFLTMLGIIIGITSVITIMSVGAAFKKQMNSSLDSMAGGQIVLFTSSAGESAEVSVEESDLEPLKQLDGLKGVTPYLGDTGTVMTQKGEFNVSISGGSEAQEDVANMDMVAGHYYTANDVDNSNRVGIISHSDAIRLFGTDDVIGMNLEVTLYGITLDVEIIGVRDYKEESSAVSFSYEDAAVSMDMPYTTLADWGIPIDSFYYVYLLSDGSVDAGEVAQNAVDILNTRHDAGEEDYFQVQNFNDYMTQINDMLGYVTAFISLVAAISLLVGGIGVMNIMLVSVTERTREIGIRKSLGAKTSSIMWQFLSESAIIAGIGGIIGIILGVALAVVICNALKFPIALQASSIILATVVSCGIGIFFGIYPARKAAKLSPIEALRRE